MQDSTFKTLNDEGYKNWIKGGLGLRFAKTLLCEVIDSPLKSQYDEISETTTRSRDMMNIIKSCHLLGNIHRANSKLLDSRCHIDERYKHVEFGKCFIQPPGYIEKMSISDIDISGLMHILIYNKGLHTILQQPPERHGDKVREPHVFLQGLKVRNDIVHCAGQCLSKECLDAYMHILNEVIGNLKMKCADQQKLADDTTHNLLQLQKKDFHVSTADEFQVLQGVIASFNIAIKNLERREIRMSKKINRLQEKVENHEDRILALEHVKQIQKESANLERIRDDLIYRKKCTELQFRLIDLYEKFYVKTVICPFIQKNNDVDIEEIYAKPNIKEYQKVVTREIEPPCLLRKNNKDNRKVFVIGNVGTGKTSLCLFFLRLWCHSGKERRANESNTKSDEFDNIIQELKKFDFVFFLPLCAVSEGIHNFEEMIKTYYKNFNIDKVIDDLLERESEKCLIIADGLHEWKLPQNKDPLPLHQTYGIPVLSTATKSTVIVTSRPTAIGILNMRKSDRDLEVNLLGVISIESMIEKYYVKQDDTSISKDDILKIIKKWTEDHKLETPMLISCFVWMLTNGHDIEQSCISATYSSVINIMLEWLGKKSGINNNASCDDKSAHVQLPKMLEKYEISPERRHIILHLGRIAFDMHKKGYTPISQRDVETYCSGDQLKCVIDSGILLKKMRIYPNKVHQLSFIHSSFLEYFVALHLVINNQHQTTEILKQLFATFKNSTDIMELSNVIVFICGLSPQHTESVFKHIYKSLSHESAMVLKHKDIFQTQELVKKCLLEHRSSSNTESPNIPLYALLLSGEPIEFNDAEMLIKNVDVGKVMNLTIATCRISNITNDNCFFLKVCLIQKSEITASSCLEINGIRADKLKSLSISKCTMAHGEYLNLVSIISQASALELLILEDVKCETNQHESDEKHIVDLSNNSKIKSLSLIDKKNTLICKIDKQNLENDILENCMLLQRDLSSIDFLLKAQNLQHLHFGGGDECSGSFTSQMNDVLQTLAKLQTLHVSNMVCSDLCPIGSDSMKDLHNIKLSNVKVTPESFRKFLDDILGLQQYVKLEAHCLFETKEELHNSMDMITKIENLDELGLFLKKITDNSIILCRN